MNARSSTLDGFHASAPASARVRVRRSCTSTEVRSDSCRIPSSACRYSSALRGLRSATSAVVRMSETGVRSSWDASAVNRVVSANAVSRRASMSFSVSESRCSSSPVAGTSSRRPSCRAEIARAVPAMRSTGASARRLIQKPPRAAAMMPPGMMSSAVQRNSSSASCSSPTGHATSTEYGAPPTATRFVSIRTAWPRMARSR